MQIVEWQTKSGRAKPADLPEEMGATVATALLRGASLEGSFRGDDIVYLFINRAEKKSEGWRVSAWFRSPSTRFTRVGKEFEAQACPHLFAHIVESGGESEGLLRLAPSFDPATTAPHGRGYINNLDGRKEQISLEQSDQIYRRLLRRLCDPDGNDDQATPRQWLNFKSNGDVKRAAVAQARLEGRRTPRARQRFFGDSDDLVGSNVDKGAFRRPTLVGPAAAGARRGPGGG